MFIMGITMDVPKMFNKGCAKHIMIHDPGIMRQRGKCCRQTRKDIHYVLLNPKIKL